MSSFYNANKYYGKMKKITFSIKLLIGLRLDGI